MPCSGMDAGLGVILLPAILLSVPIWGSVYLVALGVEKIAKLLKPKTVEKPTALGTDAAGEPLTTERTDESAQTRVDQH